MCRSAIYRLLGIDTSQKTYIHFKCITFSSIKFMAIYSTLKAEEKTAKANKLNCKKKSSFFLQVYNILYTQHHLVYIILYLLFRSWISRYFLWRCGKCISWPSQDCIFFSRIYQCTIVVSNKIKKKCVCIALFFFLSNLYYAFLDFYSNTSEEKRNYFIMC